MQHDALESEFLFQLLGCSIGHLGFIETEPFELGQTSQVHESGVGHLRFAESLDAKVVRLKGKSVADTVAEFVRSKHITQVIFGRAPVHDWRKYLYLSAVHRFLRDAPAVDVHIVKQEA